MSWQWPPDRRPGGPGRRASDVEEQEDEHRNGDQHSGMVPASRRIG